MSYDRRKVLRALTRAGIGVLREGGNHTVLRSPDGRQTSLPRHSPVKRNTVRGAVEDLGLDWRRIKRELS